jgi:AsmA-like C-terminal region
MASRVTAERQLHGPAPRTSSPLKRHHKLIILGCVVFVALCILGFVYIRILPFSEQAILKELSEASDSQVTAHGYHRTHFPSPGCVLERVEFHKGPKHFMLVSIDKLVIKGTYLGLLRHHVHHINAIRAHIFIPPFGTNLSFESKHSNTVVEELIANGALVEFESSDTHKNPLVFDVHEALLTDIRWDTPINYRLKFHNPEPPGEISVNGKFGAWTHGQPEETPISGEYSFDHANLGVYGGIAGYLSSQGKFQGVLKHIDVLGQTDTPDFEVTSGGHRVNLTTKFDAYVDGMHGDTYLKRIEAHFGRTTVVGSGSVARKQGRKGKFTELRLAVNRGRIEDILGLFVSAPRSPMSGGVSLTSTAELRSGDDPFLQKLQMNGRFGVGDGSFTNPDTQTDVDKLSAGARGENKDDPDTVLSDLTGTVQLIDGIAQFSNLSFGIPGAKARLHGTYSLESHKVNLHGAMRVETRISKTTSGFKSLLLKVMDPIFKKKKKGEIVPVHLLGTYEKPDIGLDLNNQTK